MEKEEIIKKQVEVESKYSCITGLTYEYNISFQSNRLIEPNCLHVWRYIEKPKNIVDFANTHKISEVQLVEWLNNNYTSK